MALRVWLPLNGNINNYGISDAIATNSGATVDNNGKIGKCYSFNGSSAKISTSINLTPEMSFCTWVKFNSVQNFVIDARNSSGQGYQPMYISSTGVQIYSSGSPSGGYINYSFSTNVWYHLVVSYSNNKGYLYVNGTLVGTIGVASLTLNNSILTIGSRYSSERSLNGKLNDIRVYDHALSPKEVKELSKGLCLHYKLDGVCNTIDSTEWDCSGFGNNGIKNGSITVSNDTGRYSSSYKFGTTSSKIKLPAFSYSGLANSYSFSWWQKNTGSGNMPWGFSDGNRLNLYHTTNLCWNTGDGGGNPFKDSSGTAIPNTRLCDSTWHHCVVTGNGSTTKLYIDGIYAGAATTYKAITGTQIYISGWDTSTSYTFSGSNLSDFRIYATVLSDADIKELYNTPLSIDNVGNMYTYEFKEI